MNRLTFSIRGLAAIALCSLLIGQRPLAAQETCSPDLAAHSFNLVAVGMCDSDIILATPIDASHWWSRTLQIPQQGRRPTQASLARTGTKLGLYYADTGEVAIWDLTAPDAPSLQPTHYITRQTYEFDGKDGKIYRDDHGRDTSERYLARKVDTPGPLVEGRNSLAGQRHCEWSTYQVEPEPGLYAPILEFTSSEQVFPSTTGIWPLSQVATQPVWAEKKPSRLSEGEQAALSEYRTIFSENDGPDTYRELLEKSAVYYRVLSCSGSWLYQYWIYYPFDVGRVQEHLHDPEHLFVEVSKLGGEIIGVLAASHPGIIPNNLYSSLTRNAEPVTLPLAVLVEDGKHALAPDINRDGKFMPGVDVNVFPEVSQVWGIRDYVGNGDVQMHKYQSSMTFDRDFSRAWASRTFDDFYGGSQFALDPHFAQVKRRYQLLEFPVRADAATNKTDCRHALTTDCAELVLNRHEDFVQPSTIYKRWSFPSQQIRVGSGSIERSLEFSVGYVTDFKHFPWPMGPLASMPGRLAFEVAVGPHSTSAPKMTATRLYYGLEYERSVTNIFGYYIGYLHRNDYFDQPAPGVDTSSNIYHLGIYTEFSKLSRHLPRNIIGHFGPAFSTTGNQVYVEARVEFAIWSKRGRTRFGYPFK